MSLRQMDVTIDEPFGVDEDTAALLDAREKIDRQIMASFLFAGIGNGRTEPVTHVALKRKTLFGAVFIDDA